MPFRKQTESTLRRSSCFSVGRAVAWCPLVLLHFSLLLCEFVLVPGRPSTAVSMCVARGWVLLMVLFLQPGGSCEKMGVTPPLFASPPVLISISQSRCFKTFKYASKRRVGINPHYREHHPATQRAPKPSTGGLKILLEVGTALRRGCAHGCSVSTQLLPAKCSALLGLQNSRDTSGAAMPGALPAHGCCTPTMGAGAECFLAVPKSSFWTLPRWPGA